jgi:hypothetical protein
LKRAIGATQKAPHERGFRAPTCKTYPVPAGAGITQRVEQTWLWCDEGARKSHLCGTSEAGELSEGERHRKPLKNEKGGGEHCL